MPQPIDDILLAIGRVDDIDELQRVDRAVGDRFSQLRARIAHERAAAVHVGDRIEVTGASPQYLNGMTGVVSRIPSAASVEIRPDAHDPRADRFIRPDGTMRVHAGTVVVIAGAAESGEDGDGGPK